MRAWFYKALINSRSTEFRLVSNLLALLTVVSIISLVLETVPALESYEHTFLLIEWTAVVFFTIEYLGRLYFSKPKYKYIFSLFGIIDLVSILPTILGLGNFTFLKSARALRILRLLRMLRLAKLGRAGMVDENMSVLSLNILIYFSTLLTALLVTGTAMYLVEPEMEVFTSIPAGMWWSLKVFMAGIPVVEPQTGLGEIFFVLTRFVGLLLLGLLVGVVGNVFRVILMGRK
jgi:voltage-gated potassium channel